MIQSLVLEVYTIFGPEESEKKFLLFAGSKYNANDDFFTVSYRPEPARFKYIKSYQSDDPLVLLRYYLGATQEATRIEIKSQELLPLAFITDEINGMASCAMWLATFFPSQGSCGIPHP